jgi:hypothetical protein
MLAADTLLTGFSAVVIIALIVGLILWRTAGVRRRRNACRLCGQPTRSSARSAGVAQAGKMSTQPGRRGRGADAIFPLEVAIRKEVLPPRTAKLSRARIRPGRFASRRPYFDNPLHSPARTHVEARVGPDASE